MRKQVSNKLYFPFLILNKIFGFIFQITISRLFGQEIFGQLSYATSIANVMNLLNDLSISQQIIRDQKCKNKNKLVLSIFIFKFFLSLILISLFILLFNSFEISLILFVVYLVITSLIPAWYFVSNKKQYLLEFIHIINTVSMISVLYFSHYIFPNDKIVLSYSFIMVSIVSIIISFYLIKPSSILLFSELKNLIVSKKESILYLTLTMIIAKIYYDMDIFIIGYFYSFNEVAEYSYAFKYFALFYVLYGTYVSFFFPITSRLQSKIENMNFNNIIQFLFLLCSFAVLIGIFLSPYLITLIAGKEIESSVLILKLLFVTTLIVFLKTVFGNFILSFGYDKQLFKLSILGAIINFSLNILFIPLYGVIAATITTLITELILTLFEYRYFLQEYHLPFPMIQFIVLIISIFASIYFVYILIPILIYLLFSLKNYRENIKYTQRFLNA